jgi:multisubunit Na+/H+ antiporter MnhG subunit
MTTYTPSPQHEELSVYAMATASAAAGCALGLLFGRGMGRKPANISALTLLAAGALIAAPAIADVIRRAANRPGTERGSQRRLDGIRDGARPEGAEIFALDDGVAA